MGKAILLIVAATSFLLARGMLSNKMTERETSGNQVEYQEEVLSREIARSGYNVARRVLESYGNGIAAGVNALNGHKGYYEDEHQGGVARVFATFVSGHTVELTSIGYFGGAFDDEGVYRGGAVHIMGDSFHAKSSTCQGNGCDSAVIEGPAGQDYELPQPPLKANETSELEITYLESEAGHCSALFIEEYLPDGTKTDPQMIFPAGHYNDNTSLSVNKTVESGTQMNMFIGVDVDCSTRPGGPNGPSEADSYDVDSHVYDEDDYDWVHYALDVPAGSLDDMQEGEWSMTEQHPDDEQTWRIGFEDLHHPEWNNPESHDHTQSLQALKRFGYDGDGWPNMDGNGYRDLEDHWIRSGYSNDGESTSYRPDFSDQVVQVRLVPSDPVDGGSGSGSASCDCPKSGKPNKKVQIMHDPPGKGKPRLICVSVNGWLNGHKERHDDYVVCQGD